MAMAARHDRRGSPSLVRLAGVLAVAYLPSSCCGVLLLPMPASHTPASRHAACRARMRTTAMLPPSPANSMAGVTSAGSLPVGSRTAFVRCGTHASNAEAGHLGLRKLEPLTSKMMSASWRKCGGAQTRRTPCAVAMQADTEAELLIARMQCPASVPANVWSDLLLDAGALYVSISDGDSGTDAERPIFATHPTTSSGLALETWEGLLAKEHLWSNSTLEVGFATDTDVESTILLVAASAELSALPRVEVEEVAQRDWVTHVQSNWPPVEIADCLCIRFPWHEGFDSCLPTLMLQPGMAFGTGEHATTQLCCSELRRLLSGPELEDCTILDYGSGSGVLAFAALLFGASAAVGVEIDPEAVTVSEKNAALNDMDARFSAYVPDDDRLPAGQQYPLVVANILAGTLVELAPLLSRRVTVGGVLLLSGIWGKEQARAVSREYADWGFEFMPTRWKDGWALIRARRLPTAG